MLLILSEESTKSAKKYYAHEAILSPSVRIITLTFIGDVTVVLVFRFKGLLVLQRNPNALEITTVNFRECHYHV